MILVNFIRSMNSAYLCKLWLRKHIDEHLVAFLSQKSFFAKHYSTTFFIFSQKQPVKN